MRKKKGKRKINRKPLRKEMRKRKMMRKWMRKKKRKSKMNRKRKRIRKKMRKSSVPLQDLLVSPFHASDQDNEYDQDHDQGHKHDLGHNPVVFVVMVMNTHDRSCSCDRSSESEKVEQFKTTRGQRVYALPSTVRKCYLDNSGCTKFIHDNSNSSSNRLKYSVFVAF